MKSKQSNGIDINDSTAIKIPLANLISLLAATAVASYAYFGVIERVTFLEHDMDLSRIEVHANSEFRTCWPLGTCGSLPADSEQFLRINTLEKYVEDLQSEVDELKEAQYGSAK